MLSLVMAVAVPQRASAYDAEALDLLKKSVSEWNAMRLSRPTESFDLSLAKLEKENLSGANLSRTLLERAQLSGAQLEHADLKASNLNRALITKAEMKGADMTGATLVEAKKS